MNPITDTYSLCNNTQVQHLWKLIGNTPFIAISYRYKGGEPCEVLVKCEQFNMTGSIKDRMALYILQKACEQGRIKPGDLILGAASGNTGVSFAAIGKALGNRVKLIMPDWTSLEIRAIIKAYGADTQLVSRAEGGFLGCIKIAEAMGHYDQVFLPRQLENQYQVEAHEKTTGREIGHSLILEKIKPAAFVAGVGTGGTVMGVGKYLRSIYPDIRIHPLEPAEKDGHRIQGISDECIPAIVALNCLDKVVRVPDGEAILMAQMIARDVGMAVGISSGANLAGAIRLQAELGGARVVTIFPDDHKRYLTTGLFKEEPVKDHYISKDVQLIAHRELSKV